MYNEIEQAAQLQLFWQDGQNLGHVKIRIVGESCRGGQWAGTLG